MGTLGGGDQAFAEGLARLTGKLLHLSLQLEKAPILP
jgi:hypothetical protein